MRGFTRIVAGILCASVVMTMDGITVMASAYESNAAQMQDDRQLSGWEQLDSAEQSGDTEQANSKEQTDDTEQADGTEKPDILEQADGTEQAGSTEKPDSTEQPDNIEQVESTEQIDNTEQVDGTEQSEQIEDMEQTGDATQVGNPEQSDLSKQPDLTEQSDPAEQPGSLEQNSSIVQDNAAVPATTSIEKVTAKNTKTLQINWKAVTGVSGYELYRSTLQNGSFQLVATLKSNQCAYIDATAQEGVIYFYKVRAVNLVATSPNITEGSATGNTWYGEFSVPVAGVHMKQAQLSNVRSISSSTLKLQWNVVAGATGYTLYRSETQTGKYKQIKVLTNGTTTQYTDRKRTVGKRYYYKIKALNANDVDGALSSAKYGRTIAKAAIIKIKSTNSTSLKITWKKASRATGYEVYRATSKSGNYKLVKTSNSAKKLSYIDKSVKTGRKYFYKIKAIIASGDLRQSGSASAVQSGRTIAPVTLKKSRAVANSKIRISWKKVTRAKKYVIYRSTKETGKYKRIKTISSSKTLSYNDAVPKKNKTYYYKVLAVSSDGGYSDYSNIVSGRTLAAPTLKSITLSHSGGLKVTWNKISGASGYTLYRSVSDGAYSKLAEIKKEKTVSYVDNDVRSGQTYSYKVQANNIYAGVKGSSGKSAAKSYAILFYNIMGENTVTAAQMAACYKASGHAYPAGVYAPRGAATVSDFVQIVLEEAAAEGVSGEVVWAQIILETGWLSFAGSMVRSDQCNFGGLGATDNSGGVFTATYPDVRTGVRAQVQHLKAYASKSKLKNPCVDTRFSLVTRGTAVYVEWLGIQENPQGYGWATGADYGFKIHRLINQIKSY